MSLHKKVKIIDIGANLFDDKFKTCRKQVIEESKEEGIAIICTGTTIQNSLEGHKLSFDYPEWVFHTVGVHPHSSGSIYEPSDVKTMIKYKKQLEVMIIGTPSTPCLAVGETGLDYNINRMHSSEDAQKYWFRIHISMAVNHKKPLFVHARDCFDDIMKIFSEYRTNEINVVIHCFTGDETNPENNMKQLLAYLNKGFYIGLTGFICKSPRGDNIRALIKHIPHDKLMVETDSPWMASRSYKNLPRGMMTPCLISDIVSKIAIQWELSYEKTETILLENTKRFFNLK